MEVGPAVEPSNILWENLEVRACERFWRKMGINFAAFLIIIASIALIYYVKTIEGDLPTDAECAEEGVFGVRKLNEAKDDLTTETEEFCWCKFQPLSDLLDDDDLGDYCEDYVTARRLATIVKIASACGIVMLNFIIKIVLIVLTRFERISSVTKETLKIMTKVFIAMFINTAFVSLIVNANLQRYRILSTLGPF